MNTTNSKLSIVIVTYNSRADIEQCLESLKRHNGDFELFVIDNNSQDGTQELLKKESAQWPALHVIYNKKNVGFTRANNQALSRCGGDYVLFLNPDTKLKPGALEKLVRYLDSHTKVGVVGPRLIYENGRYQISFGPVQWWPYTIFWHLFSYPFFRFLIEHKDRGPKREKDVGWILGAALMIRKDLLLKLGGFDENFFLSIMDAMDLCKRVQEREYQVVYHPKSEVVHIGGASWKQVRSFTIPLAYRGYLHYYKKHHGSFSVFVARTAFFASSLLRIIILGILSLLKPKTYFSLFKAYTSTIPRLLFKQSL